MNVRYIFLSLYMLLKISFHQTKTFTCNLTYMYTRKCTSEFLLISDIQGKDKDKDCKHDNHGNNGNKTLLILVSISFAVLILCLVTLVIAIFIMYQKM